MIQTLAALAEPNRLAIVEYLRDGPRSVTDIVDRLGPESAARLEAPQGAQRRCDRRPTRRRQAPHLCARAGAVRRTRPVARHVRRPVGASGSIDCRRTSTERRCGRDRPAGLQEPRRARDRARARAARLGRRRLAQLDDCCRPGGVVGAGGMGDHGALARCAPGRPLALRHGSDRLRLPKCGCGRSTPRSSPAPRSPTSKDSPTRRGADLDPESQAVTVEFIGVDPAGRDS